MYTAKCDGALLYDPRVDELQIPEARLDLEVNKTGSFSFSIPKAHPMYSQVKKLKSVIEVFQDDTLIFRGRALRDTADWDMTRAIECEGDLAFFNDSVMRAYSFTGAISDYLSLLIDSHNSQVAAEKQFTLGTVTVTDPNNTIVRSNIEYTKTWTEINDKLVGLLGGYIRVRRVGETNYVDYLAGSSAYSTQKIELGANLLDAIQDTRADDVITALIPLGAKIKDTEGNDTDVRLTIADINNGDDFVYDEDAVEEYGWLFDTQTWDDVTDAENLKAKAEAALAARINLGVSVELKAIDLAMVNVAADKIRVFENIQVTSPPHGIDEMVLVTKLTIDLLDPRNNTVSFGFSYETFTDKQVAAENAIKNIQLTPGPKGADAVIVDVISTQGSIFRNGTISSTLLARVYQAGVDVTDRYNAAQFIWTRTSSDPVSDAAWNTSHAGGTKQIAITQADVYLKATFNCELIEN